MMMMMIFLNFKNPKRDACMHKQRMLGLCAVLRLLNQSLERERGRTQTKERLCAKKQFCFKKQSVVLLVLVGSVQ